MSTTVTDVTVAVDSYVAAWNETDPAARQRLIEIATSQDVCYVDPMMGGSGHDGLSDMIAAAQEQLGEYDLRRIGAIDHYQDRARFSWEVVRTDGTRLIAGTDFAILAPDGRLQSLTGFFDTTPGE